MKLETHRFAECGHDVGEAQAEALDRLLKVESAERMAYIPIPHDEKDRCWVADYGVLIGTIENRLPEATFGEWYATPKAGGDELGPYRVARAAAAALLSPERRKSSGSCPLDTPTSS